jgi:uncharacterized membrane protein YoaK (UPF0700 family)
MDRDFQKSESNLTMAFLTMSGGLQDAYTYINRGGVFANAQTGNIVRMSENLLEWDLPGFLSYLFPVLAFALGVIVSEEVRVRSKDKSKLHWREYVVVIEILILFVSAFIPHNLDALANALISLSCAMQVEAFKKVHGFAYASTMCIGNLRSGTEALHEYLVTKDKKFRTKALEYFGMITIFAVGAGIGTLTAHHFGIYGILPSCLLLIGAFITMIKS